MKILVVDDSPPMRQIIKNALRQIGYEDIIEASDGEEAYSLIDGVDILITDWNMPKLDGLSLIKKIRADKKYASLLIMMVTTEGGKSAIVDAIRAGANNYVVKPFTKDFLKQKVEQLIKMKK